MSIIYRNFIAKEGPLLEAYHSHQAGLKKAREEYTAIMKDIGAEPGYYHIDGFLVGIVFPKGTEVDPKLYKMAPQAKKAWLPKKNCKEGKELYARIRAVKVPSEDGVVASVGLGDHAVFTRTAMHRAGYVVIPSEEPVIIVRVPWKEISPEDMEEHKEKKAKGEFIDMDKRCFLWEPHESMTEVKGWEVEKMIDEWNESLEEKSDD